MSNRVTVGDIRGVYEYGFIEVKNTRNESVVCLTGTQEIEDLIEVLQKIKEEIKEEHRARQKEEFGE